MELTSVEWWAARAHRGGRHCAVLVGLPSERASGGRKLDTAKRDRPRTVCVGLQVLMAWTGPTARKLELDAATTPHGEGRHAQSGVTPSAALSLATRAANAASLRPHAHSISGWLRGEGGTRGMTKLMLPEFRSTLCLVVRGPVW